jgi:L-fuculose-phosphate aldolase
VKHQGVRSEIIRVCQRLTQRAFVAAEDGAVSARISQNKILITPAGRGLGWVSSEHLVMMDMEGQMREGELVPSPAFRLHLAAYHQRREIAAVIHAQPPAATAFAVAGTPLVQPVLPQTILTLGAVAMTKYAPPYTEEAARAIDDLIQRHDALLLKNRGILTIGTSLMEALQNLERAEQLASTLVMAKTLGRIDLLSGTQVSRLMALREDMNFKGKNPLSRTGQEKQDG